MDDWESPGGGEVIIGSTGLYIEGEYLEDNPPNDDGPE